MKKIILILMIGMLSLINASEFTKDGKTYQVEDKDYIIRCIDGYQWIQFIESFSGKGSTHYSPSGNPQQMFRLSQDFASIPIKCKE